MPSENRRGEKSNRQNRTGKLSQRTSRHIIVVTDGRETEINYITGLREAIADSSLKIKLKQESSQLHLVKECLRMKNLYAAFDSELWILFDRDDVKIFDAIITDAEENGVNVAWSNPCIEIWFSAYFGNIPTYTQSGQCIEEFKNVFYGNTHTPYRKNDEEIYRRLTKFGDERKAIERAENLMREHKRNGIHKPSQMTPGTTVYKLVKSLQEGK